MKKIIVTAVMLLFSLGSNAQSKEYAEAMESAMQELDRSSVIDSLQEVANTFERIFAGEPKEWLPSYHAAFVYTLIASRANLNEKDKYLDKADEFISKSENISPMNDEIEALKGFVYLIRMTVDPKERGMKYAGLFYKVIGAAKKINPENPRPYGLQSLMIFNTPEQFGGGIQKACPEIKRCTDKFSTFKPVSTIHPKWGLDEAQKLAKNCP